MGKYIPIFSDFIVYCSDNSIVETMIIRNANLSYVHFISNMMVLWKHDEIARIVESHIDKLSIMEEGIVFEHPSFHLLLRLEFISVLTENDNFCKVNDPQNLIINEINKLNDELHDRNTLMFIVLHQFFILILSENKSISKMALHELLIILNYFDLDSTFSIQSEREKVFNMLFPIVIFIIDDSDKVNEWITKDTLDNLYDIESLYIIFFFIIKNLAEETIQQWLVSKGLPSLLNSLMLNIRKALLLFSRYPYPNISKSSNIYLKHLSKILEDVQLKDKQTVSQKYNLPLFRFSSLANMKSRPSRMKPPRLSSRVKLDIENLQLTPNLKDILSPSTQEQFPPLHARCQHSPNSKKRKNKWFYYYRITKENEVHFRTKEYYFFWIKKKMI